MIFQILILGFKGLTVISLGIPHLSWCINVVDYKAIQKAYNILMLEKSFKASLIYRKKVKFLDSLKLM